MPVIFHTLMQLWLIVYYAVQIMNEVIKTTKKLSHAILGITYWPINKMIVI